MSLHAHPGAPQLHITPTLMGDASTGTNTKSMLVFWLIFGASHSTEEAQPHFFFPPSLGMLKQEGWDISNSDRSCG